MFTGGGVESNASRAGGKSEPGESEAGDDALTPGAAAEGVDVEAINGEPFVPLVPSGSSINTDEEMPIARTSTLA